MTRELRVANVPQTKVPIVSALLFELGCSGIHEDAPWIPHQIWDSCAPPHQAHNVTVRAWFDEPVPTQLDRLRALDINLTLEWVTSPDVDWIAVSQASFPRVVVGDLVISPPWSAEPGDVIINPGQGFGTGHSATTQMALRALLQLAPGYRSLLDIGCGSGVIAIVGALRGLEACGIDNDPVAIADAKANSLLNDCQDNPTFRTQSAEYPPQTAELVIVNMHAELLVQFREPIVGATEKILVLSGILSDREDLVETAYRDAGRAVRRMEQDGWVCLTIEREP